MRGQAYINNKDIFATWGASFANGAYEALLKPAPNKAVIQNKSRLLDGKCIIMNNDVCKTDERDITISFWIVGESQDDYLSKYKAFVEEITSNLVQLKVPALGATFRLVYLNCSSYGDYGLTKGKLTLKMNEANIKDRNLL